MPDITFSTAMTANQTGLRPLANWRFRRLPYDALVTMLLRATTTGARFSVLSGTTEVVQRSPVQGGGTAGVTPVPNTTPLYQFYGAAGDEIDLAIDEVSAGTPTVDGWVNYEPA